MTDSEFHTYTPRPANVTEWRVQRAVHKFMARQPIPPRESAPLDHGSRTMQALVIAMSLACIVLALLIGWAVR